MQRKLEIYYKASLFWAHADVSNRNGDRAERKWQYT